MWYDKHAQVHEKSETIDTTEAYLRNRDVEIIVQVEGIDELTGQALQARPSYRWNDLAWDCPFAPCVQLWTGHVNGQISWLGGRQCERRDGDPICSVDFACFHDIVPVQDVKECP
jgi:hypothetical protein